MGKSKELSSELKKTIVRLALKGYSLREIGNIVNKSHSTIQYVVNKFKYRGFTANQKRKPKEKILNEREKRFKIRQIKSNPRLSVPKPRSLMTKTTRKTVSVTTVRRVLYKYGFHGRRIRKRPFEPPSLLVCKQRIPNLTGPVGSMTSRCNENKKQNCWKNRCCHGDRKWHDTFLAAGPVLKKHSGGRRTSDEMVANVQAAYERSPRKSLRRPSRELQIPKSTLQRIVHKRLKLYTYKVQLMERSRAG
ncbi:hypothetical protein ANN_06918 [Periplaneta americana]|uniref:Sleeping Beauty transposase HTH domain-containing protein n=1 Tax=Periplaneta americana TaxID=6978 RepID=A0ABQ8TGS5_PERAM|nr:hypothetical protein ANN_06918 [Periplaneta americana]